MNDRLIRSALLGMAATLLLAAEAGAADDPLMKTDVKPGTNRLVNPSFELDEDGDGVPDGWSIHREARGERTDEASDGSKAMRFTEGTIVISQNLQIADLPGRQLRLKIDARSPDGAQLGVFAGCLRVRDDDKGVWRNSRLTWNRSLRGDYVTHRMESGWQAAPCRHGRGGSAAASTYWRRLTSSTAERLL